MKEVLYTIPVNEAFQEAGGDCPLCRLRSRCEGENIETLMRSAYMEPDCRIETNQKGFCPQHLTWLYAYPNRLGLALMLETHIEALLENIGTSPSRPVRRFPALRHRMEDPQGNTCYLCEQVDRTEVRYIATILHLYEKDAAFQARFSNCGGFCLPHYRALREAAGANRAALPFLSALDALEKQSLQKAKEALRGFADGFDYRQAGADPARYKDAVARAVRRLGGAAEE